MARLKILVAGDPCSIHANRFVSLLQDLGHEVRVFQSAYYYVQEEHLKNTIIYVDNFMAPQDQGNRVKVLYPLEMEYFEGYHFLRDLFNKLCSVITGRDITRRPRHLDMVCLMRRWRPDIVFSLKMQNDGYTVADAREAMGDDFLAKWVHFSWGTDMEFFGKHPDYVAEHLPKIRRVLSLCDFHMADTDRDVRQAHKFGFNGIDLGAMLAHGGFDLEYLNGLRQEAGKKRNVILIKGREGALVGRAFNVLKALHRLQAIFEGYEIRVIMPTENIRGAVDFLRDLDGLDIAVCGRLPYEELLTLYGRALMAISASDVDGIPSFLVEAMAMGALPIHSDMESVREWINHGVNGLLFHVDDIDGLCGCIERGIIDAELVKSARSLNWKIACDRMNRRLIRDRLAEIIEQRIIGADMASREGG